VASLLLGWPALAQAFKGTLGQELRATNLRNPERVLDLPRDYSLGMFDVWIPPMGSTPGRHYKVEARGKVVVPAGRHITFEANDGLFKHPEILSKLPPYAFDVFTTGSRAFSYIEEGVFDRALKYIGHLKQLHGLKIDHSDATNDGIAHAAEIPELIELTIADTKFTGAPLKDICKLKRLAVLIMCDDNLDESSFSYLPKLPELQTLRVCHVHHSDTTIKYVGQCKGLIDLDLSGSNTVNDNNIKFLANLKKLKSLKLHNTRVTIKGLQQLKGVPLNFIKVSKGVYKNNELESLRRTFPGVEIFYTSDKGDIDGDNNVLFAPLH
jgi:hypothetical protein